MKGTQIQFSKSAWREASHKPWQFFCPFCGITRRLRMNPRPQPRHFVQVGVTSAFLTALAWPLFGIKGLVVFLPLWIGFEFLYRMRVRAEMSCNQCGFDPFLFLTDESRAKGEMAAFWGRKTQGSGASVGTKTAQNSENSSQDSGVPADL